QGERSVPIRREVDKNDLVAASRVRHLLIKRCRLIVPLVEVLWQEGEMVLQPLVIVRAGVPIAWLPPAADWSKRHWQVLLRVRRVHRAVQLLAVGQRGAIYPLGSQVLVKSPADWISSEHGVLCRIFMSIVDAAECPVV